MSERQPALPTGPDRGPDRSGRRRLRRRERLQDRRQLPFLRLRVPARVAAQRPAVRAGDRLGVEDLRRGADGRGDRGVLGPPLRAGFFEIGATATEPAPEGDSAAEEWKSPQGTKTAQFVPDPAMLAGARPLVEPTPVASLDMLPKLRNEAAAAPQRRDAAAPVTPTTTPAPADPGGATGGGRPDADGCAGAGRANRPRRRERIGQVELGVNLDGALQASDSPAVVTEAAPPVIKPEVALPPRPVAAPPPAGISERRQPPAARCGGDGGVRRGGRRGGKAPPHRAAGRSDVVLVHLCWGGAAVAGYLATGAASPPRRHQAMRVRVMTPAPSGGLPLVLGTRPGHRLRDDHAGVRRSRPARRAVAGGDRDRRRRRGRQAPGRDGAGDAAGARSLAGRVLQAAARQHARRRQSGRAAPGRAAPGREGESGGEMAQAHLGPVHGGGDRARRGGRNAGQDRDARSLPGAPVARVKGSLLHGAFELDDEERATLAKLDFCRVEVIGLGPRASNNLPSERGRGDALPTRARPRRRSGPAFSTAKPPATSRPPSRKIEIPLPGNLGLVSGQPLRLARRALRRRLSGARRGAGRAAIANRSGSRGATARPRRARWRWSIPATKRPRATRSSMTACRWAISVIVDPPASLQAGSRMRRNTLDADSLEIEDAARRRVRGARQVDDAVERPVLVSFGVDQHLLRPEPPGTDLVDAGAIGAARLRAW